VRCSQTAIGPSTRKVTSLGLCCQAKAYAIA
jgi:hypothetical protein